MKRKATGTATGPIVVRVGGKDFHTSRETLEQDGRGYFAALLHHQEPEMEGTSLTYYVDRDPEPFCHVLAWMRSRRLPSAIATERLVLEDLEAEATFYALDELVTAVRVALVPLRRAAEPLRAFSITCGCIMDLNAGSDVQHGLTLAPHEYCFISYATCKTIQFSLPRKHHHLMCSFEERKMGTDDPWTNMVPRPSGPSPAQADFPNVHAWHREFKVHEKAVNDHVTSRVVLASFVYKHLDDKQDDPEALAGASDKEVVTDGVCQPQFSERLHAILGPRGVHNPDVTGPMLDDEERETRLMFGPPELFEMDNGATWSLFGVVGPAEKVLEYAMRSA